MMGFCCRGIGWSVCESDCGSDGKFVIVLYGFLLLLGKKSCLKICDDKKEYYF